jgi:phage terminase large subunit-like protein
MPTKKTRTTSSPSKVKKKKSAEPEAQVTVPTPPASSKSTHIEKANQYIEDVLSGKIPACSFVKAACERQRNDLVRLKDHPLYYWDPDRGAKVCRFLERLPHIKGPKANAKELCVLEPWQCFIVTTAFGWRRKDKPGRRFKRVYIEVPRGNGKSFLSAGIGLFCTSQDEEQGAEVYSAATTRDQAKIVWGDAKSMMTKRMDFASKIGIETSMYAIYHTKSNSSFRALSREASNQDGLNVHCAVIDELHAHKTRETYDVVETATAKRENSLIWIITTAGSDTSGICYEVRGYVKKVLEGLDDDTQFGIIYTIDEGDEWSDSSTWMKANPNWNVSVIPETFAALAFKAMQTPSAQSNFKTKYLNVWVNADAAAFDMRAWDKCGDPGLRIEEFAGQECVAALDLASKIDIVAKARIFTRALPGKDKDGNDCYITHYYLFTDCFLPEAAIADGRNSQYEGWAIEGWLQSTPGDVVDFAVIKDSLIADGRDFKLREIGYDPWQATQLAQEMMKDGATMVEVRPTVQNFSAPMKELDALMRAGRLHHDTNPVMRWMISNTVCHTDAKDNIYPRKEKPENKIDGVVAAIMALGRAMVLPPPPRAPRIRTIGH